VRTCSACLKSCRAGTWLPSAISRCPSTLHIMQSRYALCTTPKHADTNARTHIHARSRHTPDAESVPRAGGHGKTGWLDERVDAWMGRWVDG
jgi:hypothetical protein